MCCCLYFNFILTPASSLPAPSPPAGSGSKPRKAPGIYFFLCPPRPYPLPRAGRRGGLGARTPNPLRTQLWGRTGQQNPQPGGSGERGHRRRPPPPGGAAAPGWSHGERPGSARLSPAQPGSARLGPAGLSPAGLGSARPCPARFGPGGARPAAASGKSTAEAASESVGKVATVYLLAKNRYFLVQFGSHVCTAFVFFFFCNRMYKNKKKWKHLDLTGLPKNLTNSANPDDSTEAGLGFFACFFFSFPFSFNIRTCLQVVTIQRFLFTIITTTIKN